MASDTRRPATVGLRIPVDGEALREFCGRWKIVEFSFFGSVLREDFRPDSDVDVAVRFAPDVGWSAFDVIMAAEELSKMWGRTVDLIERDAIRNPYIRHEIETTRKEMVHVGQDGSPVFVGHA